MKAGRHKLGVFNFKGIGKVSVDISVGRSGKVSNIITKWPKDVEPELFSTSVNKVYATSRRGGIFGTKGEGKCTLIHAGGQCLGCSKLIWVQIINVI